MGSTPRNHTLEIPLPTRNSEAGSECFGRIVLSYLREEDVRDASYFILGSALHHGIEQAILYDLDPHDTWEAIDLYLDPYLNRWAHGEKFMESTQRGMRTIVEDAHRMITNWFAHVHPDSDKRHPFYDDWQWPPRVEVPFLRHEPTKHKWPVWGQIDAEFYADNGHIALVDWKSGVKRPNSDFQLQFYRYGRGVPEAKAAYHMLDRIRKSSIVLEVEDYPGDWVIQAAATRTEQEKHDALAGLRVEFKEDWYCGYCPVQHICPKEGPVRQRKKLQKQLDKLQSQAVGLEVLPHRGDS